MNGYQRKFNAPADGYLYLNLIKNPTYKVEGVLVKIKEEDLPKLIQREVGYECVNVTDNIDRNVKADIFTFIAPDKSYPDMKILQSYINTCLEGVAESKRQRWLLETVLVNKIEDDTNSPQYEFASDVGCG